MGTVRARQKSKTTTRKVSRRVKDKKRDINIASNPIIEANWDYSLTLKQNYKRLGLTVKLGREAGGAEANVEKPKFKPGVRSIHDDEDLEEKAEEDLTPEDIPVGEARIVRDDKGEVVKVIYGTKKPLDGDLELVEEVKVAPKTEVVKQLEAYANRPLIYKEREQSTREEEWIKTLIDKYGDDYSRMKWDKKLNIHQQSEGDLRKRCLRWKKKNGL
jgi:nucleolar protein 16